MHPPLADALRQFLDSPAPEDSPTSALADEWLFADHVIRLLEHRKAALREELLRRARLDGESTEKGGSRLVVPHTETAIVRKVLGGPVYTVASVQAILDRRPLPPNLTIPVYQTRVREEVIVNPDAMRVLEALGYFTPEELTQIRKPPPEALEVVPDANAAEHLEDLVPLRPGMTRKGRRAGP